MRSRRLHPEGLDAYTLASTRPHLMPQRTSRPRSSAKSQKKRRDAKQCQHAVRAGHLSEKWVNYDGGYGHGGWPCLEVGTLLVG